MAFREKAFSAKQSGSWAARLFLYASKQEVSIGHSNELFQGDLVDQGQFLRLRGVGRGSFLLGGGSSGAMGSSNFSAGSGLEMLANRLSSRSSRLSEPSWNGGALQSSWAWPAEAENQSSAWMGAAGGTDQSSAGAGGVQADALRLGFRCVSKYVCYRRAL